MEAGRSWGLLAAALLICMVVVPAPVAAETQELETPAGTFYLVADGTLEEPSFSDDPWLICITLTFCIVMPTQEPDPGHQRIQAGLWQETNGCPGLQMEADDVDDDGKDEAPDEQEAWIDQRVL